DSRAQRGGGPRREVQREKRSREPAQRGIIPGTHLRQLLEQRHRAFGSPGGEMNLGEQRQGFRIVAADGETSLARELCVASVALPVKIDCAGDRIHAATLTRQAAALCTSESHTFV